MMKLIARSGPLTDQLRRVQRTDGAGQVPRSLAPEKLTRIVCGYCSTGCSLDAHIRDGHAVNLSPSAEYPVNRGMACPKGWEALAPLAAPDRLQAPMLRRARGRGLEATSWDEALDVFVDRVRRVQDSHGPESMAFLSTGQIVTEEMAFLGALTKFGMGMRHGDGNTRQCMATSVVAHKQSFGFDAPPYTYADFEESDVVVLVGSNLAVAHPIMWQRLAANPHNPAVVVVDPRHTETAQAASHHLQLAPKSDLVLLYGLANLLIEMDAVDEAFVSEHTNGFEEMATHVADYGPRRVAEETGLSVDRFAEVAALIAKGRRVSFWWTMGVNQSHQGVRTAQAIINLALMTGNIGRPGTGANSITGQCNAMGSRLFSNTTGLFGARDFANDSHRDEISEILEVPEERIPRDAGWSYDRIVEGINREEIRGLWVVATNGAHSWVNQTEFRELLGRLEFLVVQDLYATTETAELADLVLPAAGWGEKCGTFINSERRFGLVQPVCEPPGEARTDFDIFAAIAQRWGCADMFSAWTDPEEVFGILKEASRGTPCDFTGIAGYEHLEEGGGIQWPHPEYEAPEGGGSGATTTTEALGSAQERRLFADGRFFHADGRARFVVGDPTHTRDQTSERYPLVLLTGRGSSAQWHTQTRTGKSPILAAMHPAGAWVEMHPDDVGRNGFRHGDRVIVETIRGQMEARVMLTPGVAVGTIFVAMHDPTVNRLTAPSFDPESRQPSFKHSAALVRSPEPWDDIR